MIAKKQISILLTLVLLIAFPTLAFANEIEIAPVVNFDNELITAEMRSVIEIQNKSNDAFNQLLEKFVELNGAISADSPYPARYPVEFAGSYINDDNKLVILLTDRTNEQTFLNYIDSSLHEYVLFETAEYSMNELDDLSNDVADYLMNDFSVLSYGIDEINNEAYVEVPNEQLSSVLEATPVMYNQENMPISIRGGEPLEGSALITGGQRVYSPDGSYTTGFTGSFGGVYALMLCGHGLSSGDRITLLGNTVGTVSLCHFIDNQYGDYAIIPLASGNTPLNNIPPGAVVTSYDARAVHSLVYGYGQSGGYYQGLITENNGTNTYTNFGNTRIKGVTFVNLTKGQSKPGDSGGPLYVPYGNYYAAVGILGAGAYDRICYTPMGNTTYLFNVLTYAP